MRGRIIRLQIFPMDIGRFVLLTLFLMPYVGISNFNYIQGWTWLGGFSSAVSFMQKTNLVIGFLIVLLFAMVHKSKISIGCVLCMLPYVYLIVRTALAGGTNLLKNLVVFLMMLMLMEMFFLKTREWFLSLVDSLNFYTVVNFVFIIKYVGQGGLTYYSVAQKRIWKGYYFLGYDNGFIILILLLVILNLLLYRYSRKRKYLLMMGEQILSEILVFSATSLIILVVWGILFFYRKRNLIGKLIYQPICVISGYLILFWLVVIIRVQNFFNIALNQLFGKDIESARMVLWEEGLQRAKDYFLFGQGYMLGTFGQGYKTPHIALLEWMGYGGIIFAVLYLAAIFYSLQKSYKYEKFYEASIIYSGIVAFILGYMAEGYGTYICFWAFPCLLLFGADIDKLHALLQDGKNTDENTNF